MDHFEPMLPKQAAESAWEADQAAPQQVHFATESTDLVIEFAPLAGERTEMELILPAIEASKQFERAHFGPTAPHRV